MAISFVGVGAFSHAYNNVTITLPAHQEGDYLVIHYQTQGSATVHTGPGGGWVQIGDQEVRSTTLIRTSIWAKFAGPSEANPTFNLTDVNKGGYAVAFRGVDTSTPQDATPVDVNTSSATSWQPAGITTATDGAWMLSFAACVSLSSLSLGTANGFTLRAGGDDYDTTRGASWGVGVATKEIATAGASTSPTWSAIVTGEWTAHSLALRPSAAAGPPATTVDDAYIGRRSVYPYDLLGGTATTAVMWDPNIDPTGNNRDGYDPAGEHRLDVRITYVDGTTSTGSVTFDGPPVPSTAYDVTYGSTNYGAGDAPTASVTVPAGDDPAFAAVVVYQADKEYTALTLGGVTMSTVASFWKATEGHGFIAATLDGASMPAAGSRALEPVYQAPIFSISVTHFHWWMLEGAPGVGFTATAPVYNNGTGTISQALTVPANTTVMSVAAHDTAGGTLTNTWDGTAETALVTDSSYDLTSQAEWKLSTGGDVSVTWSPSGNKGRGVMIAATADVAAPSPITPGTPSLTTPTAPGDNQLRTTWSATSNAVAYEGRIGTSNPPTTSPISLGNVTTWTRSGLAPSTLYYMQVRAISSTGTYSAWSTAVSGTTNTSSTVVAPISQSRLIHGQFSDINAITHSFNTHRTDGVLVPNWHGHYNFGPTFNNVRSACTPGSTEYGWAQSAWTQNASARPALMTEIGQRTFITTKLAFEGNHQHGTQPGNSVLAAMDLARSGSTGTDNRNDGWRDIGAKLAQWPGKVIISLSHESNGFWYANYSGVNTKLVGSSTLASVPDSQFGAAMGAAIRQVAVDGNMATVHRLAAENAATMIWEGGPGVIICYVLAESQASAPPSSTPGNMTSVWQSAAHPRPQFFDCFVVTTYCRGNGRPIYKGSGDVNLTSSWTFPDGGLNSPGYQLAQQWNRPYGWWELGANWDVFDWEPTYTQGPTDDQSHIFWKYASEFLPQMNLAFITYWHAGSDNAAGSTYRLGEANYGKGKTTGTNPKFPKTLNLLRNLF
jgi:hypothetical protein